MRKECRIISPCHHIRNTVPSFPISCQEVTQQEEQRSCRSRKLLAPRHLLELAAGERLLRKRLTRCNIGPHDAAELIQRAADQAVLASPYLAKAERGTAGEENVQQCEGAPARRSSPEVLLGRRQQKCKQHLRSQDQSQRKRRSSKSILSDEGLAARSMNDFIFAVDKHENVVKVVEAAAPETNC